MALPRSVMVWCCVLIVVAAGCVKEKPPSGTTPTSTTGNVSPNTAPSGPGFDPVTWDEPTPPRADRMTVSLVDEWTLKVVGTAGAVEGSTNVLVGELGTGRGVLARSNADGSFQAQLVGAEGGTVMVGTIDGSALGFTRPGTRLSDRVHQILHAQPSTYLRVPFTPVPDLQPGERALAATSHFPDSAPWRFSGAAKDDGASIHLRGDLIIKSAADVDPIEIRSFLSRVFDEGGAPIPEQGAYATSAFTASGLPLEGETKLRNPTTTSLFCTPNRINPTDVACSVDLAVPTNSIRDGGYVLRIFIPHGPLPADAMSPPPDLLGRGMRNYQLYDGVPLTLFARGLEAPMRPATLLFVDAPSAGTRGVQAVGDDATWGWTNRVLWQPSRHIMPRTDATGRPIPYTFEPYLPQVYLADRDSPGPPLIDLVTPGGEWNVVITAPDGSSTRLGPAPFQEIVSRTATSYDGRVLNHGGGNINGVPRLATLRDEFHHAFDADGVHKVVVSGTIDDASGNEYAFSGTYDVLVAEPMDVDFGTLPGTPLSVLEPINRALQFHPPVPAQVSYRLRAWTGSDADLSYDTTTTGAASRFGWFHDGPHHPSTMIAEPGEYRVDIEADYTDPSGRMWAGAWTFGGVITDGMLDVHGRRGIDLMFQDEERFTRAETGLAAGGNHFNFPYHTGDVAWQTEGDSMEIRLTVADPDNEIGPYFTDRVTNVEKIDPADEQSIHEGPASTIPSRFSEGQGALYRTTASGEDTRFGDEPDRFGYTYGTVERPGIRVREAAKEDLIPNGYWRFGEMYTLQPGMGPQGDAPNDYKFLFGGAVMRVPGDNFLRVGGYSALWIEIGDGDPRGSRINSAFAPDAGPLFEVGGKDVFAFFEPTGVRPGSLLVEGDTADFGGYVVPLGAQQPRIKVTSPSGKLHSTSTGVTSNPYGHLHLPSLNFPVDEPGIWTVDVNVTACPPLRDPDWPCRYGGLNDGSTSYTFYVASKDAEPLGVSVPTFLEANKPLLAQSVDATSDGHATAWMPGWLLDSRPVAESEPILRYEPSRFGAKLPNFDWARPGDPTLRSGYPDEQVTFTALAKDGDGTWRGLAVDTWGARVLTR